MKRSLLITAACLMAPLTGAFAMTTVPAGQQNQTIEAQATTAQLTEAQTGAQNTVDSKNALIQAAGVQAASIYYQVSAYSNPPIDVAQPIPGGKYVVEKLQWPYNYNSPISGYGYPIIHVAAYNKNGILEREDWVSIDKMYDYNTRKMKDYVQEHYIKWYDGSNGMFWDAWREKFDCYGRLQQRDMFDMHMNLNNCYKFDPITGKELEHMYFEWAPYKKTFTVSRKVKVNLKGDAIWIEHYSPGASWGLFGGWYNKKEYLYYDSNGKLIRKDFYGKWGSKIYRRETWDPATGQITNVQLF